MPTPLALRQAAVEQPLPESVRLCLKDGAVSRAVDVRVAWLGADTKLLHQCRHWCTTAGKLPAVAPAPQSMKLQNRHVTKGMKLLQCWPGCTLVLEMISLVH